MKRTNQIATYVLIALIVAMLGALLGWYLYIHSKQSSIQITDSGRGLDTGGGGVPSFGDGSNTTPGGTSNDIGANPLTSGQEFTATSSSPLWRIEKNPVAGFNFIAASTTANIQYVARASGYVLRADPTKRTTTRITSTSMPKIYEAFVAADGSVVLRSIADNGSLTTFLGSPRTATSSDSLSPETTLSGTFATPNMRHVSLNSRSKTLIYSIDSSGGETISSIPWTSTKSNTLFSAPITNWSILSPDDGRVFIVEAPSSGLTGYAYELKNGTALPTATGEGLLIQPQPNGTGILWSTSSNGVSTLYARIKSNSPALTLSVHTIASKCVWAPSKVPLVYCAVPQSQSAFVLDDWFAGITHTNDVWWQIDLSTNTTQVLFTPSPSVGTLDVQDPKIDPTGNFLVFLNGSDGSLWSLKINN